MHLHKNSQSFLFSINLFTLQLSSVYSVGEKYWNNFIWSSKNFSRFNNRVSSYVANNKSNWHNHITVAVHILVVNFRESPGY